MSYTTYTNPFTVDDTMNSNITTSTGIYDSSPITITSGGTSGQFLTSTGINGTGWTFSNTAHSGEPLITSNVSSNSLTVRGKAEFEDDITIKGVSLTETLNKINERLAILKPNPELESRWDQLKELRRQYEELEADILEKELLLKILEK